MGNTNSTTINQTIDVINQNMVNSFTSTSNTAYVKQASNQVQNWTLGENGSIDCGNYSGTGTNTAGLIIQQGAQTTVDLKAEFDHTDQTQLLTSIQDAVKSASDTTQSQVHGWLSAEVLDSNKVSKSISEHIQNIVSKNITSITQNQCIADASNIQNQNVVINGKIRSNGCYFGQNFQGTVAVNCISSTVQDLIANDKVLNDAMAAEATKQDNKSKGVESAIGAGIFALLIPVIIVVVLAGVLLIVLVAFRQSRKKRKAEAAVAAAEAAPGTPTETTALLPPGSPASSVTGGGFGRRRKGRKRRNSYTNYYTSHSSPRNSYYYKW